jgi:hypothetical protein
MKRPSVARKQNRSARLTVVGRFRPALEALESRYAPSCTYNASTHVLTGTGNDAAVFFINGLITNVYCNGNQIVNVNTNNATITFNGGSGTNSLLLNDSVYGGGDSYHIFPTEMYVQSIGFHGKVNANVQTLTLKTGAGGDSITQGTSFVSGMLFAYPKVIVDGGGGSNTFIADDSGQGSFFGGLDYTVSDTQIFDGAVGLAATYSNIQYLTLKTSTGDDYVTVTGPGNKLFSSPQVTVDAGFGTNNELILDDSGATAGGIYGASNQAAWAPAGIIYHSKMDLVTLKTGAGNDDIYAENSNYQYYSIPVFHVDAGGGTANKLYVNDVLDPLGGQVYTVSEDTFSMQSTLGAIVTYNHVQNLDVAVPDKNNSILVTGSNHSLSLVPKVSVGGSTNSLIVDDSGYCCGDTYQISKGAISLPNSLGTVVTYTGSMASVELDTGSGNDTVADICTPTGGDFVTVKDQGGTGDSITVDCSGAFSGGTYQVEQSQLFTPTGIYTDLGFENLTLKTGLLLSQAATVNIDTTPSGGTTTVIGGKGDDTLVAGLNNHLDGLLEPVAFNGGDGIDSVVVNDSASTTNNVYVGSPTSVSKLGGPVVSYAAVESVTVNSGSGRDLMIAGTGKMKLVGNGGEDILIGGHTNFDTDATALNALMAEWTRTDLIYQQRVRHITRGGGLNGTYKLNPATVHGNGGGNTLLGGSADKDLFFGSQTLDTTDWNSSTESFFNV